MRIGPIGLVAACGALTLAAGAVGARSAMFQGGPSHLGRYGDTSVSSIEEVAWSVSTGGPIRGNATVADDAVYFGSGDGDLYSVTAADGVLRWTFHTGGAVHSTPAVAEGQVIFASRDHILYDVDQSSGKLRWKFQMGSDLPFAWGFDAYLSSPTVVGSMVYVGSGDGNVYALDLESGRVRWQTDLGCRLRSSPAVADGTVYIGGTDGIVYAIDASTGAMLRRFQTEGATLDFEDVGFDRRSIMSSPAIVGDRLLVGSRDGRLYAFDRNTGAIDWTSSHKTSWVISSPTAADGEVFVGSSDGRFVQAVDLASGHELWRVKTPGNVWASFAVAGDLAYVGDWGGTLFAFDRKTGEVIWRYHAGGGIYGSPVIAGDTVYVGSEDGRMVALRGLLHDAIPRPIARRVVYWEDSPAYNWFHFGVDVFIRDTLRSNGYDVLDGKQLADFMRERLEDRAPSVVIFAKNVVPATLLDADVTSASLLRQFLQVGRVVWLGPTPLAYVQDPESGKTVAIDFERPTSVLGLHYAGPDTRAFAGYYRTAVTEAGARRGLHGWFTGMCAIDPSEVTSVFAVDEYGRAGAWEKTFGGPEGTGLVQLWVDRDHPSGLAQVMDVAEFGLR